jgi:hypothetical protein
LWDIEADHAVRLLRKRLPIQPMPGRLTIIFVRDDHRIRLVLHRQVAVSRDGAKIVPSTTNEGWWGLALTRYAKGGGGCVASSLLLPRAFRVVTKQLGRCHSDSLDVFW